MLSKLGPIMLVAVALLASIAAYPHGESIPSTLDWPAIETYFTGRFRDSGFSLICGDEKPGMSCQVRWKSSKLTGSDLPVYACYDDRDMTRDHVLSTFLGNASTKISEQGVLRVLGVLDGFFESGLRRACDQAVRRARENPDNITSITPFKLGQRTGSEAEVVAIDSTFGKMTVGIPARPAYNGDVSAQIVRPGSDAETTALRIVAPDGTSSIALLAHSERNPCQSIWPNGPNRFACQSIAIHQCDAGSTAECRQPLLEVHALPQGGVLLRAVQQRNVWLASRTSAPLDHDEIITLGPPKESRLYVAGTTDLPGFVVEVFPGGRAPVSQLRLVNGHWTRWTLPNLSPWLSPVTADYDGLSRSGEVQGNAEIKLSLDLDLQAKLEKGLAVWMRDHVEAQVRQHLRAAHYHSRAESLISAKERGGHRRPIPEAGVTVLDPASGSVLAVASYPPQEALKIEDGAPTFGPGWEERLAGADAPGWARRAILEVLIDRLRESTNSNFSTHPIGSTFKPILLSLTIDTADDHLEKLFDLVVAGHLGTDQVRNGGDPSLTLSCGKECAGRSAESIVGLPVGPWGREEGAKHGGVWIDRWEFLLDSCNKYALSLGVLSLMDWHDNNKGMDACCWNTFRDRFGFVEHQFPHGGTPEPFADQLFASRERVPRLGPWAQIINGRLSTSPQFPDAPIFARLQSYFGVSSRSRPSQYDADPWVGCGALEKVGPLTPVGRLAVSQLDLTSYPVETSFTNLFTGSGRNWWSNLKLAEAYSRLSTNRAVRMNFCGPPGPSGRADLFRDSHRQAELIKILSLQRQSADWVRKNTPQINSWQQEGDRRVTLSKTGTSLRSENSESTGVFALFLGEIADRDPRDNLPIKIGKGLVVVAHVDDVGGSPEVVKLVDSLLPALRERL